MVMFLRRISGWGTTIFQPIWGVCDGKHYRFLCAIPQNAQTAAIPFCPVDEAALAHQYSTALEAVPENGPGGTRGSLRGFHEIHKRLIDKRGVAIEVADGKFITVPRFNAACLITRIEALLIITDVGVTKQDGARRFEELRHPRQ